MILNGCAPAFADIGEFGWLRLFEDVDVVVGHALLGDQHLFAAVDHKVSALQTQR